jgi:hypothetical protein
MKKQPRVYLLQVASGIVRARRMAEYETVMDGDYICIDDIDPEKEEASLLASSSIGQPVYSWNTALHFYRPL